MIIWKKKIAEEQEATTHHEKNDVIKDCQK